MLFLDQEIYWQNIESDSFQEKIWKLKSLEEMEKYELNREKDLLSEQLNAKYAKVKSLMAAQDNMHAK